MRAFVLLFTAFNAFAANQANFTVTLPAGVDIVATTVDGNGNTYLTGSAVSGVPTTPGAFQTQYILQLCFLPPMGTYDCPETFVMKLGPTGAIVYATYLGEGGYGQAIAADAEGNAYVTGSGNATSFPVTPGAAFSNPNTADGFLAKLNPSGTALVYSTFVPFSVEAMTIDAGGNAYLAGYITQGGAFTATPGAFQVTPLTTANTGAIMKINAAGSAVVYATYLSGTTAKNGLGDTPYGIAVDAAGDAFVTGNTYSAGFPVTAGALQPQPPGGIPTSFVSELNPQGTGLIYSTYLGGSVNDQAQIIKVDSQGGAYVFGETRSTNFPVTSGAFQTTPGPAFLAHLSPGGSALTYATYFTWAACMDVDSAGDAYVISETGQAFPSTPFAFQSTGGSIAMKFAPTGEFAGGTDFGGTFPGEQPLLAVAPNGSVSTAAADYVTSFFVAPTVMNAASYTAGAVAPGEIVAILGYNMGPGAQVSFNGIASPIFYNASNQINAQIPWEIAEATSAQMTISANGVSGSFPVAVASAAPGIFYINNSDGTQNSPANPAKPGEFISIYGTGAGVTDPAGVTGGAWPSTPLAMLTLPVSVNIGQAIYAGSVPTLESGFFQVNVQLPGDLPSAIDSLTITVGGVSSAPFPIGIQ